MLANKWGRIINVASAHGLVGSPFKAAYVAAKHGLVGLTKVIALETAEQGITCNAICPGYVYTPLVEAQIDGQAKAHGIPRGFPCFRCGRFDHRHRASGRWRVDSALNCTPVGRNDNNKSWSVLCQKC